MPDAHRPAIRIGHGYDLHRLEPRPPMGQGKAFIVGGVILPEAPAKGGQGWGVGEARTAPVGPVGHSDGDVLYHAVTDALLGALAMEDIGQLFPDTAKENKDRASHEFLSEAVRRVHGAGYAVGNLDSTVILERPKIGPLKKTIRANLAGLLQVPVEMVNVKGKTHERVDAVGEGRAIEAHAVVVLVRKD
jgi:2-C-methyl-D-erythritol 2,4-cyclodiphosphate synthase